MENKDLLSAKEALEFLPGMTYARLMRLAKSGQRMYPWRVRLGMFCVRLLRWLTLAESRIVRPIFLRSVRMCRGLQFLEP